MLRLFSLTMFSTISQQIEKLILISVLIWEMRMWRLRFYFLSHCFSHLCQTLGATDIGVIFQNTVHFEVHSHLVHVFSVLPFFCATSHFFFLSYKHTHTNCNMHTSRHAQPLLKPALPHSNFVRSWQCLDLVVWLFRPVFPAVLMWTGHPAGHQRIPLHGSRIAGSFYLWRYQNEWVLVSKHFTMLLQPHTKATDFQQICTYFIQDD